MKQIRIDNPCPMLVSRLNNEDGNYSCKSCSKQVFDYRGKSKEFVDFHVSTQICGIFRNDQLSQVKNYSKLNKFLFSILMFLSFLGFNVKPLSAQTTTPTDTLRPKPNIQSQSTDTTSTNTSYSDTNNIKSSKATRRKKKKRKYQSVGCPAF